MLSGKALHYQEAFLGSVKVPHSRQDRMIEVVLVSVPASFSFTFPQLALHMYYCTAQNLPASTALLESIVPAASAVLLQLNGN